MNSVKQVFIYVLALSGIYSGGVIAEQAIPAHVTFTNISGAVPKATVFDAEGHAIALLRQVTAQTFESEHQDWEIRNAGEGWFRNIEVVTTSSQRIFRFVCVPHSGLVPIQPDGTQDSLECDP
jgi:hypothetical protein